MYCFTSTPASSETCRLNYHYWNDIPTFNGCSTVDLLSIHSVWMMNNDDPPTRKLSKWLKRNNKSGFAGLTVVDSDLYKTFSSSLNYYCLQHSCNILIDLPLYNVLISLLSECLYILWSSTIKTVLDIYSWSCYSASWQHYTDGGPPLTTADLRDAVILQLWGTVSTYTCVSHQLHGCECWVGGLWEEVTLMPLVDIEWVGREGGHSDGLW